MYKLAMAVLKGEHEWLEAGIAGENTEFGNRDAEIERGAEKEPDGSDRREGALARAY
jgi:hypothetical protein